MHTGRDSGNGLNQASRTDIQADPTVLANRLASRIPPMELFRARLEPSHIAQFAGIQNLCAAFELVSAHAAAIHVGTGMLQLLGQIARRHLNEIKVMPAPATFASQCIDHLTSHSAVLKCTLDEPIAVLNAFMSEQISAWLAAPELHLEQLNIPLEHSYMVAMNTISHALATESTLLAGMGTMLTDSYESYLRSFAPVAVGPGQWVSLEFARARENIALNGPAAMAEIRGMLHWNLNGNLNGGARLADLVQGRYRNFATDLTSAFERLEEFLARISLCDRHWFAQQFGNQAPAMAQAENTLIVRALCSKLRLSGESAEDVENLARSLLSYVSEHNVSCMNMLESEIHEFAPTIAPQSLTRALRHIKFDDPNCPVSVSHKNEILRSLDLAEKAIARVNSTTSP
jgi:hypothetical protein